MGQQASRPYAFDRAGTNGDEPGDRPAYWRQLFVTSYLDLPNLGPNADRDSDRPKAGLILLGYARTGAVRLHDNDGEVAILVTGSSLLLFDCTRAVMARLARHELFYLALPRREVVAAIGRDPVPADGTFLRLPDGGLTPILSVQMRTLTEQGSHLSVAESAAAVRAAAGLALALLSQLRDQPVADHGRRDDVLFAAAQRYLERHCGRHDLTADHIAAALGCSRAHLYRLFAARRRTVGGVLRDVRLRRAHALIETQSTRPIGLIAYDNGYTDLSAFGKAFKRRFGVSPSDWRSSSLALVSRNARVPASDPAAPVARPTAFETPRLITGDAQTNDV